jgi:hypothetical protein
LVLDVSWYTFFTFFCNQWRFALYLYFCDAWVFQKGEAQSFASTNAYGIFTTLLKSSLHEYISMLWLTKDLFSKVRTKIYRNNAASREKDTKRGSFMCDIWRT